MAIWRITFRPHRGIRHLVEDVEADGLDMENDGAWFVLWRQQIVVYQLRRVVVRRISRREASVELICGGVMVSPDGRHRVEQVLVQRDLRRPPKAYLRVTRSGYWIADCASPAEVGQHLDLSTLTPRQR